MRVLILMGSPRKNGNTQKLLAPFAEQLQAFGHTINTIWLYDKEVHGCEACRCCQRDWTCFGASIRMTYTRFLMKSWQQIC